MNRLLILWASFLTASLHGQQTNDFLPSKNDSTTMITIITTFDKSAKTKDGYILEGYIVDLMINDEQARKLDTKKIKITGQLFIEKSLNNTPPEYDETGKVIIKQGRMDDTRHILSPVFKVVRK